MVEIKDSVNDFNLTRVKRTQSEEMDSRTLTKDNSFGNFNSTQVKQCRTRKKEIDNSRR